MARKPHGLMKKCPSCGARFYICLRCDRGRRYCTMFCRQVGRKRTFCRSSRIYQKTEFGAYHHRRRQKIYRKNHHLKNSVTQQSSDATFRRVKPISPGFAQKPNQINFKQKADDQFERCCIVCRIEITWFINSS